MQKRFVAFLIAALVAAGTGLATAQERFGGLTGLVTDASGAVLPGATVTITSKTTGAARTLVTGGDGLYNVPDLDPGRYTMVVELSGFSKVSMEDVAVSLGKTLKVDAQLKVGDLSEVVQVQAEARPAGRHAQHADRAQRQRRGVRPPAEGPLLPVDRADGAVGQLRARSKAASRSTAPAAPRTRSPSTASSPTRWSTASRARTPCSSTCRKSRSRPAASRPSTAARSAASSAPSPRAAATCSAAKATTTTRAARWRRPGQAPGPRSAGRRDRSSTSRTASSRDHRNEFGGSLGGPIVRDRLFFFGVLLAAERLPHQRLQLHERHGARRDRPQADLTQQAFGKLTYSGSRVNANWSALWTPTTAERHAAGYNGAAPNIISSSLAAIAAEPARAATSRPGQHQRHRRHHPDELLVPVSARGGYFHDRYTDTGIPNDDLYTYQRSTIGAGAVVPANLQGPRQLRRTRRARRSPTSTPPSADLQRRLQPRVQRRAASTR